MILGFRKFETLAATFLGPSNSRTPKCRNLLLERTFQDFPQTLTARHVSSLMNGPNAFAILRVKTSCLTTPSPRSPSIRTLGSLPPILQNGRSRCFSGLRGLRSRKTPPLLSFDAQIPKIRGSLPRGLPMMEGPGYFLDFANLLLLLL
jgi:hypothetical protein